ncbi:MAG: TauD/TfdA family dioxygenase [Trichodesmium sp. MO_231.B1]|nr:TauD/TfdA family dioxygenase [Trichodesmium sp. MO_231.B1]
MNLPTLAIEKSRVEPQHREIIFLSNLAASICEALKTYPHYVVVDNFSTVTGTTELTNLAQAIRTTASPHSHFPKPEKISVTKVRINQKKAGFGGGVTRYSRTHLPLAPHTDSSYMSQPHELVAFQCVVADNKGGETIMVPVEDILQHLDDEVVTLLRDPVYPFGKDTYPIISGTSDYPQIRYYRSQIDLMLADGLLSLSEKHQFAIDALDALLTQTDLLDKFYLKTGQIVLMHNQQVLHGRTGFSEESDRLLYRVRLQVPGLGYITAETPSEQPAQLNYSSNPLLLSKPNPGVHNLQQHPEDVNTHLASALKLQRERRFDLALKHYQRASELTPNNPDVLNAYGHFLLLTGQFTEATAIFRQCVAIDPNGYDSRLALSSLAHQLGNNTEAKNALIEVTQRHPYIVQGRYDPQKPTILRMRGFERSAYQILEQGDGTYQKLLRGGHFSIRNLVNKSKYNLVILNIFENNIDMVDNLPEFNLILNTIACPDSKRESLLTTARFVDRYPNIPLINHPRRVLETSRERNSLRLNLIPGVQFPKTERLWWDGTSIDAMVKDIFGWGFVFPIIVRQVGSQTGQTVGLVHSEAALRSHFENSPVNQDYYVIQFKDCRNQQGIFNKTRVFFIDGNFYPVAHLFNNSWNTHSGDRYNVMNKFEWMQAAEKSFLGDPYGYLGAENFNKLYQIRDLVGLDFFGIDFTILPDGTLFIFELNAAMRHNFDHAKNFPYTEPHLKRISHAFNAMVQKRHEIQ